MDLYTLSTLEYSITRSDHGMSVVVTCQVIRRKGGSCHVDKTKAGGSCACAKMSYNHPRIIYNTRIKAHSNNTYLINMPSATSLSKVLPLKTTFRYSNEYPRSFIDKDQMKICTSNEATPTRTQSQYMLRSRVLRLIDSIA